jgi:predicted MFS family arabinose efflux permease
MSERYGHKVVGGIGMLISAIGFLMFATLGADSGFLPFLAATLVIGVGAPLAMTPATTAIVASLPREKQGIASAVNDTSREIGAAFGVAVLGSAFNIGYRGDIETQVGGLPDDVAEQVKEAPAIALRIATDLDNTALASATRDAFTSGMRYAVIVGAALLAIGAAFVWLRGASREEEVLEDELDIDLVIDDVDETVTVPAA